MFVCTCNTLWDMVRHSLVVPDSGCLSMSLKAEIGAHVDAVLTFQDVCPAKMLEVARLKGSKNSYVHAVVSPLRGPINITGWES